MLSTNKQILQGQKFESLFNNKAPLTKKKKKKKKNIKDKANNEKKNK
jgi:hypothetical protein